VAPAAVMKQFPPRSVPPPRQAVLRTCSQFRVVVPMSTLSALRKTGLTTPAASSKMASGQRYCCTAMENRILMPRGNSVGVVSGLLLVTVLLVMIGSFRRVAAVMHGPAPIAAFELAGSSRPAP